MEKHKFPVGVCKCGLCFDYEIVSIFPPKVVCKHCKEEIIREGDFDTSEGRLEAKRLNFDKRVIM